jgi:hypothetical protein
LSVKNCVSVHDNLSLLEIQTEGKFTW